jgi:hypothetical protein
MKKLNDLVPKLDFDIEKLLNHELEQVTGGFADVCEEGCKESCKTCSPGKQISDNCGGKCAPGGKNSNKELVLYF